MSPVESVVADIFLLSAAGFLGLAVVMAYRAVVGPTIQDRVLAVNVLGTNTVIILAALAIGLDEAALLDVALVYALLNFVLAIAVSKFTVERGGVL